MFDFQEWWYQIDWAATGSMLAGIGTCIAAGFAVFIAIKQNNLTKEIAMKQNELTVQIADKQLKQTELELKIALYDKRYTCYQLLSKYLYIGSIFKHQLKEIPNEIQKQIIETAYYKNEVDRESVAKELQSLHSYLANSQNSAIAWMQSATGLNSSIAENYERNKTRIMEVDRKLVNIDYEYSEKQIAIIRTAKFCFPMKISEPIIKYISLIFSWDAYEKKCLNRDEILKQYNEICEKKIVSQMESLMKLPDAERRGIV